MMVVNDSKKNLDTIFFTLNPGLDVTSIAIDGKEVEFKKELHVISVPSNQEIISGKESTVRINYQGKIQEEAAHLEVEQKRYENIDGDFIYAIEKRYAFLQSNYALLTNDVLWYPDNRVGYSRSSTIAERKSFIDFKLDVKVDESYIPISQGKVEKIDDYYRFRPEYPPTPDFTYHW